MSLQENIDRLQPIGLDEIGDADLMNRLDQKYLIRKEWISTLLSECENDYQILEVGGNRITTYSNQFIDNTQLESFNQHIRGRKSRFKARIRNYGSNGLSFLEVKRKTVHGRTVKARIPRSNEHAWNAPLTEEEINFLNANYAYDGREDARDEQHFQPHDFSLDCIKRTDYNRHRSRLLWRKKRGETRLSRHHGGETRANQPLFSSLNCAACFSF